MHDRRGPCEKHAACSVTASVINVCGDGDRHVGIYASPDNWRSCCSVLFRRANFLELLWQVGVNFVNCGIPYGGSCFVAEG